jgi:hypothetical protein
LVWLRFLYLRGNLSKDASEIEQIVDWLNIVLGDYVLLNYKILAVSMMQTLKSAKFVTNLKSYLSICIGNKKKIK